jgi:penicillin-binding protein 1A
VIGLLAFASFTFGMVTAIAGQIPTCDPAHVPRELDGHIYAGDDHTILATLRGSQSRILVPSSDINPVMKLAIVAVEDKRFYQHRGVDVRGIARAIWADVTHSRVVQGGSTITQQFVKNSCVTTRRSITRKLKEAALAWQLEQRWSKDRILTAYLNTIYFGNGAYGIQRAAQTYFNTSSKDLTLAQAALLAGLPADPSGYDPVTNPRAARARRLDVLNDMLTQHDITSSDLAAAARTPLPRPQDVHLPGIQGPAPYFANYVKQQLVSRYGTRRVFGGGLNVQTTIDLGLQKIARKAIESVLTIPNGPSAALVAIRPSTGEVLAMYGGDNYQESQFNLAVQGERQSGSAFKPFVLAAALAQGIAPETVFPSKQVSIYIGGRYWVVHNYESEYVGSSNLTNAIINSDNSVFAQLTQLVGPTNVATIARGLGITRHLNPYFAIGLGADPVSPLEMARAFSSFANGGARIDGATFGNRPRAIARIWNAQGKLVDANRPLRHQILPANDDALLTNLLEGVVTQGTGKRAALPNRPAAGKTGTTENYGDAWFVGYTPQLATAVWVGYPNSLRPMLTEFHGTPVAGGTFPAEIWKAFTQAALAKTPPQSFPSYSVPYPTAKSVVLRDGKLELDNGNCRNVFAVDYFSGSGPARTANCKVNEVDVPSVIGYTLAKAKARLALQPLNAGVVWKPATPGQRLGVVVNQIPRKGTLSSFDTVMLVLPKPLHGVVPKVVGLPLDRALKRLRAAGLDVRAPAAADGHRIVVRQWPHAGVAAAKHMRVTLALRAQAG